MKKNILTTILLAISAIAATAQTLWYDRPADHWEQALPLGNGRLGAMVYGRVDIDTIQLNEDTFWSGSPYNNCNPKALSHLDSIRHLLDNGNYAEAQRMAMTTITADRSVTGHGMPYESVGNLLLRFPEGHAKAVKNYGARSTSAGRCAR